jgi:hypothetical protein
MSLAITALVFFSIIFLAFLQEFTHFFKKIDHIPGIRLIGPLLIASFVIELYETQLYDFMLYGQVVLNQFLIFVGTQLPFETGVLTTLRIVFLFVLACLPSWVVWCLVKSMGKKKYCSSAMASGCGLVLWFIGVLLINGVV